MFLRIGVATVAIVGLIAFGAVLSWIDESDTRQDTVRWLFVAGWVLFGIAVAVALLMSGFQQLKRWRHQRDVRRGHVRVIESPYDADDL